MHLLVQLPLCPLRAAPSADAERTDEVLCGWPVEPLEEAAGGWLRVRTHYRYEGYLPAHALTAAPDGVPARQLAVGAAFADVLARPEVDALLLATLPRGALAAPVGEPEGGWQKITLPDGREGYTKRSLLVPYYAVPPALSQEELRRRAVERACSYLGTQYRWGGKSPAGIDCSGLTFMAWFFSGVLLYRDARLVEGFAARPIPFDQRQPGDLLYFPGHIALYLGQERYIHSTARAGSDGVVLNSLDPAAPDYRADLAASLLAVGSVFPLTPPAEPSAPGR